MKSLIQALALALTLSFFGGCQKESEKDASGRPLSFSTDTLTFDTLFTSIGSPTKNLRV